MTADIHALSGAYVLDAIEVEERAAFEAHLAECESCREEVDALQDAAAALAETTEEAPPPELRERILAEVERTPQLPPLTSAPRHAAVPRRRRVATWLAAAAAVVVAGGIVAVVVQQQRDEEPPGITASSVFEAPDAQVRDFAVPGGEVRIGLSAELDRMAIDGSELPELTEDRVYQVWL